LQRIPSVALTLLTLLDAVALVALVGYVLDSLLSLSSVVAPGPNITTSQAIAMADVSTPFNLLLTFYIAGILLILAFVGIAVLGRRRTEVTGAAMLVEAFSMQTALSKSKGLSPPQADPEPSDNSSPDSTL
jgi:hypothetical protein